MRGEKKRPSERGNLFREREREKERRGVSKREGPVVTHSLERFILTDSYNDNASPFERKSSHKCTNQTDQNRSQ